MTGNTIKTSESTNSSVDFFEIPDWLTIEWVEQHLQKYYKNEGIKIIHFDVKPGSAKGIGFCSSMYRVNVTFDIPSQTSSISTSDIQTSSLHLMVKVAITDEIVLSVLTEYDIYNREIEFYAQIAPKICQKLREIGEPQILAETFGVCKEQKIMIMEDLGAKGYGILPIQRGYNVSESKAILKKLATFHAVCAVLQEDHPNIFANFKNGHMSREVDVFNNTYIGNLDCILEIISTWPDFAVYTEKLRGIRESMVERWRRTYDHNPNDFNTLNHDDVFCPNFLLQFGNQFNKIAFKNVVMIDFQFAYWASPTTDLYFFLNTSVNESHRPHCFDELLRTYHNNLTQFLQRLNYKKHIPTWTEFMEQYRERKFLGFMFSCIIQPLFCNNTENVGIESLVQDNDDGMNCKRMFYKGDKMHTILRKTIPYLDQIGAFD